VELEGEGREEGRGWGPMLTKVMGVAEESTGEGEAGWPACCQALSRAGTVGRVCSWGEIDSLRGKWIGGPDGMLVSG